MRNLLNQKLERIVQPLAATIRYVPSTNDPKSQCMAHIDHKVFATPIPNHVAGFQVKRRMGNPQPPTHRHLTSDTLLLSIWVDLVTTSVKSLNRASPRERDIYLHCSCLWHNERRTALCTTLNGSHGEYTDTDDLDDPGSQEYRKRQHKEAKNRTQHSATPGNGHKKAPKHNGNKPVVSQSDSVSSGNNSLASLDTSNIDAEIQAMSVWKPDPESLREMRTKHAGSKRRQTLDIFKNRVTYDVIKPEVTSILVNKDGIEFDAEDDDIEATWLDVNTLCLCEDDIEVEMWGTFMYVDTHFTFGFSYTDNLIAEMFGAQLPPPVVVSKSSLSRVIGDWLPSIGVTTACSVIPHFIPGATPVMCAVGVCYGIYSRFGVPHDFVQSAQPHRERRTTIRPEYGPPPPLWIPTENGLCTTNSYWPLVGFKSRVMGPIYIILSRELFKQFGAESVTTYGLARMQKVAFEKVRTIYTSHPDPDIVVNTIAFVACQMEVYRQQLAASVKREQTVSGLGALLAKVSF